jgi:hypothetical protein
MRGQDGRDVREVGVAVVIRFDRVVLNAVGHQPSAIGQIDGFERIADFRPRRQGKIATFDRLRTFRSKTNSCQISIQYSPLLPWLKPMRIKMVADDETGLTPKEVRSIISRCRYHQLSVVEIALDFTPDTGVDREFVLRHGRFGKSRRRTDRGGSNTLRYGGRLCPKLARCYEKENLGCFRVELELHRSLMRKRGVGKISDLGTAAVYLIPDHLRFVAFRWTKLEAYLTRKFGHEGTSLCDEARRRADGSLRAATRFLAKSGVANPQRFLASLRINRDMRAALRHWAERFSPEQLE